VRAFAHQAGPPGGGVVDRARRGCQRPERYRRTAARYAAEHNPGPKTLALLVERGADRTARDAEGHTPLEIGRLNEKPRLVEWIANRLRKRRR